MSESAAILAKLDELTAIIERLERAVSQPAAELLTARAAAAALSVSTKTVYRLVKTGQLRAVKAGADLRIPLAEVRRYATPKQQPTRGRPSKRDAPYDARAEYEKGMRRQGGSR